MDKSERVLPDSLDWPEETEQWFEEWRDSPITNDWNDQQWSYLYDTAWLHAQLWGGAAMRPSSASCTGASLIRGSALKRRSSPRRRKKKDSV